MSRDAEFLKQWPALPWKAQRALKDAARYPKHFERNGCYLIGYLSGLAEGGRLSQGAYGWAMAIASAATDPKHAAHAWALNALRHAEVSE